MVRNMRYPQQKSSKYQNRPGYEATRRKRLFGWGVSDAEYEQQADVWPLNPDGDLLAIDDRDDGGIEERGSIAAVPGVGAIFLGAAADLPVARRTDEFARGRNRASKHSHGLQSP